jgi:transposase InsO family protein
MPRWSRSGDRCRSTTEPEEVDDLRVSAPTADYIVNFYNLFPRHSSLGYLKPDEFEAVLSDQNQARTLMTVRQ